MVTERVKSARQTVGQSKSATAVLKALEWLSTGHPTQPTDLRRVAAKFQLKRQLLLTELFPSDRRCWVPDRRVTPLRPIAESMPLIELQRMRGKLTLHVFEGCLILGINEDASSWTVLKSVQLSFVSERVGVLHFLLNNSHANPTERELVVQEAARAMAFMSNWACLLPARTRGSYLQTAHDVLMTAETARDVRKLGNAMFKVLLEGFGRSWFGMPEAFSPWLSIATALFFGALFVLGVIASIVQIETASMPVWLVVCLWAIAIGGGFVAAWWRWLQLHAADDWSNGPSLED